MIHALGKMDEPPEDDDPPRKPLRQRKTPPSPPPPKPSKTPTDFDPEALIAAPLTP